MCGDKEKRGYSYVKNEGVRERRNIGNRCFKLTLIIMQFFVIKISRTPGICQIRSSTPFRDRPYLFIQILTFNFLALLTYLIHNIRIMMLIDTVLYLRRPRLIFLMLNYFKYLTPEINSDKIGFGMK